MPKTGVHFGTESEINLGSAGRARRGAWQYLPPEGALEIAEGVNVGHVEANVDAVDALVPGRVGQGGLRSWRVRRGQHATIS